MDKFYTKGIYSNGMVLQRNVMNCIFGNGSAGKMVELTFRNNTTSTKIDAEGQWKIEFEAGSAGGPFDMELICEDSRISFTDVFVGEVWISSGQSNAQLPMERMKYSYPEEFTLPTNHFVRMITIPIAWNFEGEQDKIENPKWIPASPETMGQLSGTAYFFAKKLSSELKVPVGIINASQGGSPISAWMSKKSLKEMDTQESNSYIEELEIWENPQNIQKKKLELEKKQLAWDSLLNKKDKGNKKHWEQLDFAAVSKKWDDCEIPSDINILQSAGILWFKKEIEISAEQYEILKQNKIQLRLGTILDADKAYVNGTQVGITYYTYPPRRYSVPADLLKVGKNTITIRVQKNSAEGSVRFYKEKPYCLFTENVKVSPCAYRNVEKSPFEIPEDGVYISLEGKWKVAEGTKVKDAPPQKFFEWVPTALYNGMLSPCFNYAIAGALWYQGESDAYQPEVYKGLLSKMIMLWRQKFRYASNDMPFVIMQLPCWSDGQNENFVSTDLGWAQMRQSQLLVSETAGNTGLAVTIDAGEWNDLHPEKKMTGGTRAALEALRVAYSRPVNPAPKAVYTEKRGTKIIVQFETGTSSLKVIGNQETPLVPGFTFVQKVQTTNNADSKISIIEESGLLISENEVEIPIPQESGLIEIRFLWSDCPNPIVLYNQEGLPAAPFRAVIPE